MPSAALATTGTTLTATEYNYLPRGTLGLFSSTTSFRTTGTHTTFQNDGLSVSVTYAASRIIRVTVGWQLYVSGGANTILFKIRRGSTDILSSSHDSATLATGGASWFTDVIVFNGPASSATETFTTQIAGSVNTAVDTFGTKFIHVEDLGAQ